MYRFLSHGNSRRVGHFGFANEWTLVSEAKKNGPVVTALSKLYTQYKYSTIGRTQFQLNKAKKKNQFAEVTKNGALVTVGLSSSFSRLYSQYRNYTKGHTPYALYKWKVNPYSIHSRTFHALSGRRTMVHHAQIAWKRISQMSAQVARKRISEIYTYSGRAFPPISRFTCAASVALTRSQLAPKILAFAIGEAAWRQRSWADSGENLPTSNSLYMRAQDGHAYFTSLLYSALEGFVLFMRAIYLTILFSPTIAMAPFADSFGPQFRKTWLHVVHRTLEIAGPAFIKWGQWAATRPDLFPRDLCIELSKLHTKAPCHSFSYTRKTIEKAFGRKIPEIFDDFEEEPVASGSVAQIHRATLRSRFPGRRPKPIVVAVKVRHPGVGEAIRRDFAIIHSVAKVSNFIPTLRWLRLDESVQQFGVFMLSQVDLSREAAQLSRFIYNFRKWKDVSFPKPLYPFVHPAVLVETFEPGENVSRYIDELEENDQGDDRVKRALAHTGTHALLKMLLVDNFIHADMHPGNILVRVPQRKSARKGFFKAKPHVIFLDVGMTAELAKNDRENLLEFFKAVVLRDGRTAAECTLKLSKQQSCPNPEAFIKELEKSFTFWGTPEGDIVHPAECMTEVLEQVRRHKVNVDSNVCTVMVTTLVLEGWQRKLDPDYNVMKTLQNVLFKADWAESLTYTIERLMAP